MLNHDNHHNLHLQILKMMILFTIFFSLVVSRCDKIKRLGQAINGDKTLECI
jgi:hypothetical protein